MVPRRSGGGASRKSSGERLSACNIVSARWRGPLVEHLGVMQPGRHRGGVGAEADYPDRLAGLSSARRCRDVAARTPDPSRRFRRQGLTPWPPASPGRAVRRWESGCWCRRFGLEGAARSPVSRTRLRVPKTGRAVARAAGVRPTRSARCRCPILRSGESCRSRRWRRAAADRALSRTPPSRPRR